MPSTELEQLAELQVRRKFYIGLVNRQMNAAKALVRRSLGWRYDATEAERKAINDQAAVIVAKAMKPDADTGLVPDLEVVRIALEPLSNARHQVELAMKRIVRTLPIYAWAKTIHGFGELGLAVVLAEIQGIKARELSDYSTPGHLWSRLGLAPHAGKAYSSWRRGGGLSAEDWEDAGYSPGRLAQVFGVVTEPLLRAQTVSGGPYRAVYDRRRAAALITHPEWTKAHAHADGLRVMTKALLKDLWTANRRAEVKVSARTKPQLPVGRRTGVELPSRAIDVVSAGSSHE